MPSSELTHALNGKSITISVPSDRLDVLRALDLL